MSARASGTARKAATTRSPQPVSRGALTGLSFTKRVEPEKAERVTVFDIDGTPYTVPAVVETADAMGLLLIVKDIEDPMTQGATLIRNLVGEEGFAALMTEASFSSADWRKLVDSLWEHAFGPLEEVTRSGN